LDKETKTKWDLEKEKVGLQRELRDTQRLLKDAQQNSALIREEMLRLEQRSKSAVDSSKESQSEKIKIERELFLLKKKC